MAVPARRNAHGKRAPRRFGLAVVAVGVGIAAATGQNVAWADPGHTDSAHPSSSDSKSGTRHRAQEIGRWSWRSSEQVVDSHENPELGHHQHQRRHHR